jgi:hypothetical protein
VVDGAIGIHCSLFETTVAHVVDYYNKKRDPLSLKELLDH